MLLGTWCRWHGLCQSPYCPRKRKHGHRSGKASNSHLTLDASPPPRGGERGLLRSWDRGSFLGGRCSPSFFSLGQQATSFSSAQPSSPGLCLGWSLDRTGWGHQRQWARQKAFPQLSASAAASTAATGPETGEEQGARAGGRGRARVVVTGPSLRPGQRRIYWLLPVCGAVGLGP